jgi:hypothetical protein
MEFLLYIPEKELVLVRPGKSAALFNALKIGPCAERPLQGDVYRAYPTRSSMPLQKMRANAGRDLWRIHRAEHLVDRTCCRDTWISVPSPSVPGSVMAPCCALNWCGPVNARAIMALILEPTEDGQRFLDGPG